MFLYQIYDTGSIEGPFGSFTVNNVQVFAGYVLHIGSFMEGSDSKALSVGDEVKCKVTFYADNF
jgi:alanyl-tRNA synthetase